MRVWIEIKVLNHRHGGSRAFHPLMRVWIEIIIMPPYVVYKVFHPLMRVWIEISGGNFNGTNSRAFHPLMRVWIEICLYYVLAFASKSFTLL